MLWRLKSFWQPFWRILLWGESQRKAAIKLIAVALAILGPSVIGLLESPGYVYVYLLRRELISTPISFGLCLSILVAVIWILLAAGRAYELPGVPDATLSVTASA